MRGKSLALLVLALGCGLVASIGVTQVIANRQTDQAAPSAETQSIFVALDDIPLGVPLTAQVLKLEPWPKDRVPEGALTRIEDIEGRRARTRFFAGEPIIERKLLRPGETGGGISPLIPKGLRVVSVKVDRVSGGGGLILPGDRVDMVVYFTQTRTASIPETSTRTVLQDIRVFAVNDQFSLDDEPDKRSITNAQTVSLLVTPAQAQKVTLAGELGRIRLVLRSPEDDEQTELTVATAQDILRGFGGSVRDKEALMETGTWDPDGEMGGFLDFLRQKAGAGEDHTASVRRPQPVPPEPENTTWNIRIVRAGQVEDVELEEASKPDGRGSTWRHRPTAPPPPPPSAGRDQPSSDKPQQAAPSPRPVGNEPAVDADPSEEDLADLESPY